jgi:hypothetical protein
LHSSISSFSRPLDVLTATKDEEEEVEEERRKNEQVEERRKRKTTHRKNPDVCATNKRARLSLTYESDRLNATEHALQP